ncbi:MAG: ribonuclease E inhibitor RraB, partial [Erysipelotrichaceae bacterium]|nr:ribonuclease E inhibitor RraB [Erysipelotrichaceae bacterium]
DVFQQPEEELVAPVEKIIDEAADEIAVEPVEAVEEAAEEAAPVIDALQEAVEQAGKDLDQLGEDLINAVDAEIPAKEPAPEIIEEVAAAPVEEVPEEIAEAAAEEPAEVTEPEAEPVIEEPAAPVEEPVEGPVAEPAEEPVSEPVEETREEPAAEAEPVAEPVPEKVVLSPEEMLASLSQQYPDISVNKIATIIKTINRMRETITAEKVDIEHFVAFGSEEDRDTLANVFAAEGLNVRKNADDLTLSIFNTMDNNEADLLKTILTLANDAVRYHGTYKGWAIK